MFVPKPTPVSRATKRPPTFHPDEIQACEPRIALSASAMSAWWETMLGDGTIDSSVDPSTVGTAPGNIAPDNIAADNTAPDNTAAESPHRSPASPVPVDLFWQARQIRESTSLSGTGQTAVVIDTGIAADHVTLGGQNQFGPGYRVVAGYDFAEDDAVPYDDGPTGFHGTAVASVLGGNSDHAGDFHGIAPEADLVALRVFDDNGQSELQWIESALQWVHENHDKLDSPITTVNLSIGIGMDDVTAQQARLVIGDELAQLRQDDILVFAAAGNFYDAQSGGDLLYPASDPNVHAVSSIDADGGLSDFSQRDHDVLAAVGRGVGVAIPDHVYGWDGRVDDFANLDGSSLASPQVAGVSMVIRQALQQAGLPASADDVLHALEQGSHDVIDPTSGQGFRTVDLRGSLAWIADHLVQTNDSISTAPNFDGNSVNEWSLDDLSGLIADDDGVYRLDGGDGADTLTLRGGQANERFILRGGGDPVSEIIVGQSKIQLTGFEDIRVIGGQGDRVTLFDARGNDTLRTSGDATSLEGIGYKIDVQGVPQIYVHATAGGIDRAFLSATQGDDTLVVRPEFTSMRSSGEAESFRLAFGFEDVSVASSGAGQDRLEIFDSVGDDTLHLSPGRSVLVGDGYRVSASGFDETIARASNPGNDALGGRDTVRVYLDDTDDLGIDDLTPGFARGSIGLLGDQVARAEGFEQRDAFVNYQPLDLADWLDEKRRRQSS